MTLRSNLEGNLENNLESNLRAADAAFDVLNIANLSGWGDCADTASILEADNADDTSQLTDKSLNGNHFIQTTPSAQPKTNTFTRNGLNVIRCDSVDDFLEKTGYTVTTSLTIYKVISIISVASAADSVFSMDNAGGRDFQIDAGTASEWFFRFRSTGLGASDFQDTTDYIGLGFKLFTTKLDFSAGTIEEFVNNVSIGSVSNYSTSILTTQHARIATNRTASSFLGMDLAEQIIVNAATSTQTDLDVWNYVKAKWAL